MIYSVMNCFTAGKLYNTIQVTISWLFLFLDKLDDAVASQPRIKRDATRRSLKYNDQGRFLATTEKRKKSGIDKILTSACCTRQNEHIDIKRIAYSHVMAILQRCQKGQKCVLLLPIRHTFYFDAISQELLQIQA